MKLLIKLGGTLLDAPDSRKRLAGDIARAEKQGHRIVVVHGGGKQMTRFLEERGIASRFVNGLRVTTPEALDAVLKVLAGTVNKELVSSLIAAGSRAVGLTGIDGGLVEAEQMDRELGAVGRVVRAGHELLDVLLSAGFLPVIACVAGGPAGAIYNVNADQMAAACGASFGADRLIFLTDVPGVLDGGGRVMPHLSSGDVEQLIATGVATGGMQAKLNAAVSALRQGAGRVQIASGGGDRPLSRIVEGNAGGTSVSLEER